MLRAVDEVTADDRMSAGAGGDVDFDGRVGGGELGEVVLEEETKRQKH